MFPSVRALMYDGLIPSSVRIRQSFHSIKHMSAAANIMDLEWQGAEQLKHDWNVVIFSGTELTRCISQITWLDTSGNTGMMANPFHGASDEEIERARLKERSERGIDPVTAAKEGLLTEVEAEDEFYPNTMFVRSSPW